jgi:hypothetical protein
VVGKIQVTGLREFQKSLRDMDAGLPKLIRVALNSAAEELLDYERPRFPTKSGRARGSLKARSSQRAARIALGGSRAPYAPWFIYGGEGRRKGRPPARPFIKAGRDFGPYAALDARRTEITKIMQDALTELATNAGFEVS